MDHKELGNLGQNMVEGWLAIHICISRRFFPFRFLSIDLFFFPLLLACHIDIAIFICLLALYPVWKPPNLSAFQFSIFWRSPFFVLSQYKNSK